MRQKKGRGMLLAVFTDGVSNTKGASNNGEAGLPPPLIPFPLDLVVILVLDLVLTILKLGEVRDGPSEHLLLGWQLRVGHLLEVLGVQVKATVANMQEKLLFFTCLELIFIVLLATTTQGFELCIGHPKTQRLFLSPPDCLWGLIQLLLLFVIQQLITVLFHLLKFVLLLLEASKLFLVLLLELPEVLFALLGLFDQESECGRRGRRR